MKVESASDFIPDLVNRIQPTIDGFSINQFNEKQVNGDVAQLKNAVAELQRAVSVLIERQNRR
jgi:hypothetical protein